MPSYFLILWQVLPYSFSYIYLIFIVPNDGFSKGTLFLWDTLVPWLLQLSPSLVLFFRCCPFCIHTHIYTMYNRQYSYTYFSYISHIVYICNSYILYIIWTIHERKYVGICLNLAYFMRYDDLWCPGASTFFQMIDVIFMEERSSVIYIPHLIYQCVWWYIRWLIYNLTISNSVDIVSNVQVSLWYPGLHPLGIFAGEI